MHARAALLAVVLLAGCTSVQEQYNVRRSNISCEDANRYAFQSMSSIGYTVTELEPGDGELERWEIEEPESSCMQSDGAGILTVVSNADERAEEIDSRLERAIEQYL